MNLIRHLFGTEEDDRREDDLQKELPANWNLTLSDLHKGMKDGKRKSVSQLEWGWAREYERSLIPEGVRFPQKGDVYEALSDMTVSYMTAWRAPYTGGGKASLLKGERVWIDTEPHEEKPIGTYALPVDYAELEGRMVSEEDRNEPKYSGSYFHFRTINLNESFDLVETGYNLKDERASTDGKW